MLKSTDNKLSSELKDNQPLKLKPESPITPKEELKLPKKEKT